MPESVAELVALLDLEQIDPGLFRGRQPETRLQRVFGGQVAGQALVAAGRTVAGRTVHSLHAYFLRPGDVSVPIVYDVEATKDGRSFSTRRVVARQRGRTIFFMTASFQVPEEGFDHQDPPPLQVLAPEDSPSMFEVAARRAGADPEEWAREWDALDVRLAGDSRVEGGLPRGDAAGRKQVWIKASERLPDDPLLHACVLAYASDLSLLETALVPHEREVRDPTLQIASLDHAIWFHRPARADEWLLYDEETPSASQARGFATGRLFTRDGVLVASVAQEGLIRPVSGTDTDA